MRKLLIIPIIFLLCGCAKEKEPPPDPEVTYGTVADTWDFQGTTIHSLFGLSSFEDTENGVKIYPVSTRPQCLEITTIMTSDNNLWHTVCISSQESHDEEVARSDGLVRSYRQLDETTGAFISTDTLPSFYVTYFMQKLWK